MTDENPFDCPHMPGDEVCSVCRELVAYRICFHGVVEAFSVDETAILRAAAILMESGLYAIRKLCIEGGPLDRETIDRAFNSAVAMSTDRKGKS